ncbi:MAG: helix-hairpin-helix domain-containing protein [Halorientalis sp.]
MGLFKILKSVIGLGSSGSRSTSGTAEPGRENVDVTVEHEPDTESEDAVKGTGDETTAETEESEPEATGESEPEETEASDAEEPAAVENADASTDTIKGIGPSYAETLAGAGIETVGDLAAADAADVAEGTDLSEKRVSRWIARARGEDE